MRSSPAIAIARFKAFYPLIEASESRIILGKV